MSLSQDIESKIDIVELVREYVPLKKAGVNYKGFSPFKQEKTPSFVVSPAKQIAYCFATNQGGGPIRFLMLVEKLEFKEALQILAKKAGVELKTDIYAEKGDTTGQLYEIHEAALEHYHKRLFLPEHADKVTYLTDRGLTLATIKEWKIGLGGDASKLYQSLLKKGIEEKALKDSGIFVNASRDRFADRICFPIRNYRGSVVGFSGRTLSTAKNISKYVNSPETKIFHKSNILFGMDRAKMHVQQKERIIAVEGQMDVIALHQAGYTNVVGISGTALTDEHIRQIGRLTTQVYLCFDNDAAGRKATLSSIENVRNKELDVYIVNLGDYKDPDELVSAGVDFEDFIDTAQTHIEYLIAQASEIENTSTVQGKKKVVSLLMPHLTMVESSVEVDLYLQQIQEKLGISLQILWDEYNSAKQRNLRFRKDPEQGSGKEQPIKSYTPPDHLMVLLIGTGDVSFFRDHFLFWDYRKDLEGYDSVLQLGDDGYEIDPEERGKYELMYEELFGEVTPEQRSQKLDEHMASLNQKAFRQLQRKFSSDLETSEDLKRLQDLNTIGKQHRFI